MITEDYVSFETAKLLKEKGFDENCNAYWDLTTETQTLKIGLSVSSKNWNYKWNPIAFPISAPTIQMAIKWLREVQGLNIYVRAVWKDVEVQYGDWESAVVGYDWFVESLLDDAYSKMSIESFLTYEEAAEAAIKYCLENLI